MACLECDGTMEVNNGLLYSPDYPLPLPKDKDCTWFFEVSPGFVPSFQFLSWDVRWRLTSK